jgi:hypothetical protein
MMKELDKVREIFLSEVDEETRLDNEQKIAEWETGLRENEAIADWREHDITKQIARQAKDSYKELSLQLALNRSLSPEQRHSMWGRQDACLFILSMTEVDARGRLEQIQKEIKQAIAVA